MSRPYYAVVAALLAAAVAGCGGAQQYTDLPDKNLRVLTSAQGTSVVMGIHHLDEKCFAHYEGVVQLDRQTVNVGLPTMRRSLLVFEFYSTSFFTGTRSLKREAKITPRAGYRYEAQVVYKDSLYGIDLFEVDLKTGARRELDIRRGC